MYYEMKYDSPVGRLTLASDGLNLAGLWMEGQKYFGGTVPGELRPNEELEVFSRAKDWLDRYFNGKKPEPSELPLAPVGGEFRQTVWELLCEIPYGELTTYGQIDLYGLRLFRCAGGGVHRSLYGGQRDPGAV